MSMLLRLLSKLFNKSYTMYSIDKDTKKVKLVADGSSLDLINALPVIPVNLLSGLDVVKNLNYIKKKELASRIIAEAINNFINHNVHVDLESIQEQLYNIKKEEEK